jgi:hypothetical protein
MWVLFLIVVHYNDPKDVPGKIALEFKTEYQCNEALKSMTYWTKFSWFKAEGRCYERSKIDPQLLKNMIKG